MSGVIRLQMPVGVEHGLSDLFLQPPQCEQRQRQPLEKLQAFVNAAHTRAASTGQYNSRDLGRTYAHGLERLRTGHGLQPPM